MLAANTPAYVEEPWTLLGQIERVRDNVLVGWACIVARSNEAIWPRLAIEVRDLKYLFENGIEAMQKVFTYLSLDTSIVHQQVSGK